MHFQSYSTQRTDTPQIMTEVRGEDELLTKEEVMNTVTKGNQSGAEESAGSLGFASLSWCSC